MTRSQQVSVSRWLLVIEFAVLLGLGIMLWAGHYLQHSNWMIVNPLGFSGIVVFVASFVLGSLQAWFDFQGPWYFRWIPLRVLIFAIASIAVQEVSSQSAYDVEKVWLIVSLSPVIVVSVLLASQVGSLLGRASCRMLHSRSRL